MPPPNNSKNCGCSMSGGNGLVGRGITSLIFFFAVHLALATALFCLAIAIASRSSLGYLLSCGLAFFTNACNCSLAALIVVVVHFDLPTFLASSSLALLLLAIASSTFSSALLLLVSFLFFYLITFFSSTVALFSKILLKWST